MIRGASFALGAAVLLLGQLAGPACADTIVLGTTGFQVIVPAGLTLQVTAGTGTSADPWQVTEKYTYTNLNPISLRYKFVGSNPEPANANYFFLFTEELKNNTGTSWGGYQWDITDNNMTPFVSGSHPEAAHFHTSTLTNFAPFTNLSPTMTGGNGVPSMVVSGGGTVTNGTTWNVSAVKVHDFGNNPVKTDAVAGPTEFTVTESPLAPLPRTAVGTMACLTLLAAGKLLRRDRQMA
jgi:hypothetical protein